MALPSVDQSRIKSFTAQWLGLVSYIDSVLDLDDKPDLDALSGVITIQQQISTPLLFDGPNPFTLWPVRQQVVLNQGRGQTTLVSTDSDCVSKNWRWQARFNVVYDGIPITIPDAIFMANTGDLIDLTSFIGRSGEESFFFENPVGSGMYAFYQGTMESDEYGIIPSAPHFVEDPTGSGLYRMDPL